MKSLGMKAWRKENEAELEETQRENGKRGREQMPW